MAFLCCPLVFEFSVGIRVFVIGLNQISIFFSLQAVKLESNNPDSNRYMAVVSCLGRQDTEESVILGIDCEEAASIGLVFPIWADTVIKLEGDG